MKTYIIRDRQAGNEIATANTLEKAQAIIAQYEEQDQAEGTYTPFFYEITFTETI